MLTFNAGRAEYDPESKTVTPLPGAGKVVVTRDPDESFLYFSWEPRDGFQPPENFPLFETYVLFPGDSKWKHVEKCTSGRVFALKFLSSDTKEFFWMQSKTDAKDKKPGSLSSKDKSIIDTFNSVLSEDNAEDEEEEEPSVPQTPAAQPSQRSTDATAPTSAAPEQASSRNEISAVNILDALPVSRLVAHINSLSEADLQPLLDALPEEIPHTKQELITVIQSPQFSQSIDSFSEVLMQSGLGSIVARELDYPYSGEGVEGFLAGIRKKAPPKDPEDDEDRMEE